MKLYEVIFDEKKDKGVYALSVVEDPAMEGMFVALKKDEKEQVEFKFKSVDEEKRVLMGVALVPNKAIYRNVDGKEFNITFSEDTIRRTAHNFLKTQNNNNSSLEHEVKLNDMSVVESWIIEDDTHDKSRKYGFDYPVGSWMCTMKVDNDEVWNDYVKTGKVKGFSIDGLFSLKEIKLKNDKMSEKNSMLKEVKDSIKEGFLNLSKTLLGENKVELATAKLADGETQVTYEGELGEGTELFIVVEDGDNTPAPDGEHELEDGTKVTVAEGKVTSVEMKEEESEDAPAEPKEGEEVELASEITQISKWEVSVVNDSFEMGDKVEYKPSEEGEEPTSVSAGEYGLSDGRKIVTDSDGVIVHIKEAPVEAPQEDAESEEVTELKASFASQLSEIEVSLKSKLDEKDNKIAELEAQLASTPASKPKKHVPTEVELNKSNKPLTRVEKMRDILKNK